LEKVLLFGNQESIRSNLASSIYQLGRSELEKKETRAQATHHYCILGITINALKEAVSVPYVEEQKACLKPSLPNDHINVRVQENQKTKEKTLKIKIALFPLS